MRKGWQWKARSVARTWNEQPDQASGLGTPYFFNNLNQTTTDGTTATSAPFESGGGTSYIQTNMDLRGKVVKTENQHSSTYYGYDARHRSAWTAQQIKHFNGTNQHATKTIHYGYGSNNDLLTTTYQAGSSTEQYRHRYTYDATHRLTAVYTQLNSATELLHAKYLYNVDGSLRRTELGDKLQGIDYLYTLHGQLKAINNADLAKDYGNDGTATNGFAPDVFGQVLNYFDNDYTNSTVQAAMQLESLVHYNTLFPMYNGLITSTRWNTRGQEYATDKEHAYVFGYDEKYQLKYAVYGFMQRAEIAPNIWKHVNGSLAPKYNTNLTYADAHGNINSLSRMDDNGATQAINYTYTSNTNKLATTTHGTASRTYSYNAIGQMVSMNSTLATDPSQRTIAYTSDGLVKSVTNTLNNNSVTHTYTYDEAGMRIAKTNQGVTTYTVRDVNGNELAIYERANNATTLKELNVYGGSHLGKASVDGTVTYSYYLKDHLGNVRAEIARNKKTNGEADLLAWTDFDPTGLELPGRQFTSVSSLAPRGYQGDYATKDLETGLNHFELRDYDPLIARWTASDPYGQYHSPYVGMGNDWVNQMDEDGGWSAEATRAVTTAVGYGLGAAIGMQNDGMEGALKGAFIGAAIGLGLGSPKFLSYLEEDILLEKFGIFIFKGTISIENNRKVYKGKRTSPVTQRASAKGGEVINYHNDGTPLDKYAQRSNPDKGTIELHAHGKELLIIGDKNMDAIDKELDALSPTWQDMKKNGTKITLKLFVCKAAKGNDNLAKQFAKRYPNVKVIAPNNLWHIKLGALFKRIMKLGGSYVEDGQMITEQQKP